MLAIILAAAAVATTAPEPAQPAAASPAPAAAAPKSDGDKLVCWMEAPSGTHQKQKICATQAQLDHMKRNAQDYVTQKKFELNKGLVGN